MRPVRALVLLLAIVVCGACSADAPTQPTPAAPELAAPAEQTAAGGTVFPTTQLPAFGGGYIGSGS